MTKKNTHVFHLFLLVTMLVAFGSVQADANIVMISVPRLSLNKGDRIIGFEVRVRSGRIALLPNIPIGWSISIDNDPSWETVARGTIEVGSAALDINFLKNFMVVEKGPDIPSELNFDLSGEVIVTSDFKTERKIELGMKDFVVKGGSPVKR